MKGLRPMIAWVDGPCCINIVDSFLVAVELLKIGRLFISMTGVIGFFRISNYCRRPIRNRFTIEVVQPGKQAVIVCRFSHQQGYEPISRSIIVDIEVVGLRNVPPSSVLPRTYRFQTPAR